jgi:hypothetical protein
VTPQEEAEVKAMDVEREGILNERELLKKLREPMVRFLSRLSVFWLARRLCFPSSLTGVQSFQLLPPCRFCLDCGHYNNDSKRPCNVGGSRQVYFP